MRQDLDPMDVRGIYGRTAVHSRVPDVDKALGEGSGERGEKMNAVCEILEYLQLAGLVEMRAWVHRSDGGVQHFSVLLDLGQRFAVVLAEIKGYSDLPFVGLTDFTRWLNALKHAAWLEMREWMSCDR